MERELLLLGLLRQGDSYGYELHQFIESNLSFCTDLKKPTAYYLLDKMESKGWITQEDEQVGHRPTRRVYRLRPEGERVFQSMLHQALAEYTPATFASEVGIAFLDAVDPSEAHGLLASRRKLLLDELQAAREAPPHAGSLQLVIEHQVRHLQAELDWLDEVISRLDLPPNGQTQHPTPSP